jgi:hypothetical protein
MEVTWPKNALKLQSFPLELFLESTIMDHCPVTNASLDIIRMQTQAWNILFKNGFINIHIPFFISKLQTP